MTVEGAPGPRLQEDHISPYMFKPIVVNLDMDDGDSSTSTRSTPPHPHVKEMVQAVVSEQDDAKCLNFKNLNFNATSESITKLPVRFGRRVKHIQRFKCGKLKC